MVQQGGGQGQQPQNGAVSSFLWLLRQPGTYVIGAGAAAALGGIDIITSGRLLGSIADLYTKNTVQAGLATVGGLAAVVTSADVAVSAARHAYANAATSTRTLVTNGIGFGLAAVLLVSGAVYDRFDRNTRFFWESPPTAGVPATPAPTHLPLTPTSTLEALVGATSTPEATATQAPFAAATATLVPAPPTATAMPTPFPADTPTPTLLPPDTPTPPSQPKATPTSTSTLTSTPTPAAMPTQTPVQYAKPEINYALPNTLYGTSENRAGNLAALTESIVSRAISYVGTTVQTLLDLISRSSKVEVSDTRNEVRLYTSENPVKPAAVASFSESGIDDLISEVIQKKFNTVPFIDSGDYQSMLADQKAGRAFASTLVNIAILDRKGQVFVNHDPDAILKFLKEQVSNYGPAQVEFGRDGKTRLRYEGSLDGVPFHTVNSTPGQQRKTFDAAFK